MKWLSSILLLAGLQSSGWADNVLNLSLSFPSDEITVGTTVSFNLSGRFNVNMTSTNTDFPEEIRVYTSLYDGGIVHPDLGFYLTLNSASFTGNISANDSGHNISPDLLRMGANFSQYPIFIGDPVAHWGFFFYIDSKDSAFFDESEELGNILIDVALSGQFTVTAVGNHGSIDLVEVMSGEFQVYDSSLLVTVPEPSTAAALAGLGALGLAALRRRKR